MVALVLLVYLKTIEQNENDLNGGSMQKDEHKKKERLKEREEHEEGRALLFWRPKPF